MRKQLGLSLKSLEFDEPWIVVDMHVNEDMLERLPATNIQYCDPARPCTYVVGPGTHRRWEFLLLPHEAGQREMPHEAIWSLLAPWLAPHEARIWRAATYRFHAVVLEQWRRGRVLLAGDAAHQMPPFLAQGMCQGLRDALNLAWKLDRVLQGDASDALLDSYGTERGPQVEETTRTVKRLGQIICERDAERAAERVRALREQQGGQVRMQLRQSLLPGVRHGLIDGEHGAAGTPFPQAVGRLGPRGTAQMMDDLLPRGFLLFLRDAPSGEQFEALAAGLQALHAKAVCLCDPGDIDGLTGFAEADGVIARWFDTQQCNAALVRPDHIVYGVAADLDGAQALLEHARIAIGMAATSAPASMLD
jgi:3-(3-hydroxy-phenyl)propionate hydroxylase